MVARFVTLIFLFLLDLFFTCLLYTYLFYTHILLCKLFFFTVTRHWWSKLYTTGTRNAVTTTNIPLCPSLNFVPFLNNIYFNTTLMNEKKKKKLDTHKKREIACVILLFLYSLFYYFTVSYLQWYTGYKNGGIIRL